MTEKELPPGWAWATLGEIGEYINGRGFKKSEWSKSGRPIIRIQNLTGSNSEYNFYSGELESKHIVNSGDLLISWAATLGAHIWHGPEAALNQHIFKVRTWVNRRFLFHLINFKIQEILGEAHGSGMVHVTKKRFEGMVVPIPPLAEQERIVDALEGYLARLDYGDRYLDSVRTKVMTLADSVLAEHIESGDIMPLKELLAEPLSNGRSVPSRENGFPVLRLTALKPEGLDLAEFKNGDWTREEAEPFIVAPGDFLISRGNGSLPLVGRGGLASKVSKEVAFPDTMIRIRLDENLINSSYLRIVWDSSIVRQYIESNARTTAGIYKINQKILEGVPLPFLSMELQQKVVDSIEDLSIDLHRFRSNLNSAGLHSARLRNSILKSAFSGGLGTRERDDEPASELLERIRAERAARPKAMQGRRSSAKGQGVSPSQPASSASSGRVGSFVQDELGA